LIDSNEIMNGVLALVAGFVHCGLHICAMLLVTASLANALPSAIDKEAVLVTCDGCGRKTLIART
jgi:hypothetical protein